jgi:cell division protein FtsN
MIEKRRETAGLARMIVNFYSKDQKLAGRVLTEEDGYFSFLGLASGAYNVRIDSGQLRKLGMISSSDSINFNITANIDGDFVDGLDFTVKMKYPDTTLIKPVSAEKPGAKKDTSYTIIHEVTQEVLTIGEDSYAIQIGAFNRRDYAEGYRRKIEALTGRKSEIVIEGDFYKVRILNLKDRKEVDENIAILKKYGVTEFWVIKLTAKQQQLILTEKQDTVMKVTETATGQPVIGFTADMAIQVGAFRNESYAIAFRDKISVLLNKKITIVPEDGYYKVRISGFTSLEEMEKYLPALGLVGIRDIWILPVKKQLVEKPPVTLQPDTASKRFEQAKEVPVEVPTDTTNKAVEEKVAKAAIPPEPTISLQVALFQKRSQALRAQKRIMSKLNLPVEIVQQWDYYRVIVTGFYTREETFKYYPELAGIGYPNITLIEKK